jgi:putative transposase
LGYKIQTACTKPAILSNVSAHIRTNAKEKGIYLDRLNGHDDHMHVLMSLKNDLSISKQMQLIKGESAYWANQTKLVEGGLQLAVKYFAASVSDSKLNVVRRYIDNQQEHHRKQSFIEEYTVFLGSLGYHENDFG